MLDWILFGITIGIGWLIWSLVAWSNGQTPGKKMMKMRVVSTTTGRWATFGLMVLREVVLKGAFILLAYATKGVGLLAAAWLLWDPQNQELWDKVASTVMIDDPI